MFEKSVEIQFLKIFENLKVEIDEKVRQFELFTVQILVLFRKFPRGSKFLAKFWHFFSAILNDCKISLPRHGKWTLRFS